MSKQYTQDFKEMMVELHNNGKSPTELSQEYDVPIKTIGKWFTLAKKSSSTTATPDDVSDMRGELYKLKQENEILKKALGIFAKRSE